MGPSQDVLLGSRKAELIDRAIADDVAARALESRREVRFCTNSAGEAGEGVGVFTNVFNLRRLCIMMVDDLANPKIADAGWRLA